MAELRYQGGFSVPEFAGLLRVSASTVYRWEAARGPLALRAGQEDALQVLYREIEKRQSLLRKAWSAEFLPEAAGRARVSGRDVAFAGWQ